MGTALNTHDNVALCASLDWSHVRDGLKDSLGLRAGVQQVSQQDELPGFGESFATSMASGMIDEDFTPARLDTMLSGPLARSRGAGALPRGYFVGPTQFRAAINMGGATPVEITMRIQKWRWQITRITFPQDFLTNAAPTHLASNGRTS